MFMELCFTWSKRRKESARRKIKILGRTEEQKSRPRDSRRGATYMIRLSDEQSARFWALLDDAQEAQRTLDETPVVR